MNGWRAPSGRARRRVSGPANISLLTGLPDKERTGAGRATTWDLGATFEAAIALGLTDRQMWLVLQRASEVLPSETALDAAVERLAADVAAA